MRYKVINKAGFTMELGLLSLFDAYFTYSETISYKLGPWTKKIKKNYRY